MKTEHDFGVILIQIVDEAAGAKSGGVQKFLHLLIG
jgi:hypothetical protein